MANESKTSVAVISATEDASFVARLTADLTGMGYSVDDIATSVTREAGEDASAEAGILRRHLGAAAVVLVVLSPVAAASDQVRGEVEFTHLAGLGERLVPLILTPTEVPHSLRSVPPVLFTAGRHEDALARLTARFASLGAPPAPEVAPAPAVVSIAEDEMAAKNETPPMAGFPAPITNKWAALRPPPALQAAGGVSPATPPAAPSPAAELAPTETPRAGNAPMLARAVAAAEPATRCQTCGAALQAGQERCRACGLPAPAAPVPAAAPTAQPVAEPAPTSDAPTQGVSAGVAGAAPVRAPAASETTLVCATCGATLRAGQARCQSCGMPVTAAAPVSAPVAAPPVSVSTPVAPSGASEASARCQTCGASLRPGQMRCASCGLPASEPVATAPTRVSAAAVSEPTPSPATPAALATTPVALASAFVSASSSQRDRAWTGEFVAALRALGWTAWSAEDRPASGADGSVEVGRDIARSALFVAVLTPDASLSSGVHAEVDAALSAGKRIMALVLEPTSAFSLFGYASIQTVDAVGTSGAEAARRLVAALQSPSLPDTPVAQDEALRSAAPESVAASQPPAALPPAPVPERAPTTGNLAPKSPAPMTPPPAPSYAMPGAAFPGSQSENTAPAVASAAAPESETPAEEVAFSAYYPREVAPKTWERLLVYVSLAAANVMARVEADATARLAGHRDDFRGATAPTTSWLPRGTQLTLVPSLPGYAFNPPSLTVTWEEEAQAHEFRLRAETAPVGVAANGTVAIFTGPLLRGEIPLSVFTRATPGQTVGPADYASHIARAYRRIFASYAHKDSDVVEACEKTAEALGDRYLRDVRMLRSGERWDERLLQAIAEADIFQLFWSKSAAHSPAVEREWRHALVLQAKREGYIRPVYWTRAPYPAPADLSSIHFAYMPREILGLGQPQQRKGLFGLFRR